MSNILCIDPGVNGGVVVLDAHSKIVDWMRTPIIKHRGKSVVDAKSLHTWLAEYEIDVGVVEQVHSMPGQGVVSTFTFGRVTGSLEAIAMLHADRMHWVTPQKWKQHFKLGKDKRGSLDAALLRFGRATGYPDWGVLANHNVAEAALIGAWHLDQGH